MNNVDRQRIRKTLYVLFTFYIHQTRFGKTPAKLNLALLDRTHIDY